MKEKIKKTPLIGPTVKMISNLIRTSREQLVSHLYYFKNREILSQNKTLKNSHRGKRCFILATGPSINEQDLKKLSGEFCISISNFFVHKDFNVIRPKYHVFAESHDPITENQMATWFYDAEKHFTPEIQVLMSAHDKPTSDKIRLFSKQKIFYHLIDYRRQLSPSSEINFKHRIPAIQTATHIAIYLALYLGAKEICLLGCDHDWILRQWENKHFYFENQNVLFEHKKVLKKTVDMETEFKNYLKLWDIYKRIRDYGERRGVKIWNCTPGSFLDVFPKIDFEKIINKKKS